MLAVVMSGGVPAVKMIVWPVALVFAGVAVTILTLADRMHGRAWGGVAWKWGEDGVRESSERRGNGEQNQVSKLGWGREGESSEK